MRSRTTLINLYQGSNEKMRKTHKSIHHKGIQKCTSLYRNGVQVRDAPDRMERNSEKEILNLCQIVRGDLRIRTPLDRRTSKIWHNVIKWRGLIIRIDRLTYQRYLKSRDHYWRSNGILFTLYPTHHILCVGIIGVDQEVRVELFDLGSQRGMRNIHQRKPTHTLKVSLNLPIKLI